MRIGILYHNKKRLPLNQAIQAARLQFQAANHTYGYQPEEVGFNPAQLEQAKTDSRINLTIFTDPGIPLDHIRLCTRDISLSEELETDKAIFAQQVAGAK